MTKIEENLKIRLMLGYLCIANEKEGSLTTKVEILDKFDFSDAEISLLCGCNEQSVRNARQKRKKNTKPTKSQIQ